MKRYAYIKYGYILQADHFYVLQCDSFDNEIFRGKILWCSGGTVFNNDIVFL